MIAKVVIGFALVGIAVASWDMLDTQHTITYDQIYAQTQARSAHSPYIAKVIAKQYGRKLSTAFKKETACNGLHFSVRANKGLIGNPGRWNIDVDMVVNDQPDATPTLQPWSLVLPNRDGSDSPDAKVISDKDEPEAIVKKACEAVKSSGANSSSSEETAGQ